jgi:hypothetical protein
MADSIDKYILLVEGEDELVRLEKSIEQAREALVKSINANGAASTAARQQAGALKQLAERYNAVEASVARLGNASDKIARRGAQGRLALGAANIAQDVIQGGSLAYGINNILGMAGDQGIKALGVEALGAVGGIGAIGTALAGVAVTAGAAFLIINEGLGDAQLGWSDLDNVIGNLGPVVAFAETMSTIGQIAESWGVTAAIASVHGVLATSVNTLADFTLGWNAATEAAKSHKDEVAATAAMLKESEAAQKRLAGYKSESQRSTDERGKIIGQQLAELGGAGGIVGLADTLAAATTEHGAEEMITRGDETKTKREWAKISMLTDLGRAEQGDTEALKRLRPLLARQGMDLSGLDAAAEGRDLKKEAEDEEKDWDKRIADDQRESERRLKERKRKEAQAEEKARKEAEAEDARMAQAAAGNLQDRFNRAASSGQLMNEEAVRAELMKTQGMDSSTAGRMAGLVLGNLQEGLNKEVTKRAGATGQSTPEALASINADFARKQLEDRQSALFGLGDAGMNVMEARQRLMQNAMGGPAQRSDLLGFAAQVESGGAKDQIAVLKDHTSYLKAVVEYNKRSTEVLERGIVATAG